MDGHGHQETSSSSFARRRLESSTLLVWIVIALALVLVTFRAAVYLRFEQLAFDSDQAIVGLMAKHLIEGRAFPLFFYGQTYMLGVEAWAAAPFFVVAGPTVLGLRLSMLAWNALFVVLLMRTLHRDAGLGPWASLAAAVPFVAAPASVATQLMD